MLFEHRYVPAIKEGRITRTYRLWKRPQVKAGRRYRLDGDGVLEVDAVEVIRADAISDRDARASGFAGRRALIDKLGERRSVGDATAVYRVDFHFVPLAHETDRRTVDARLSERDARELSDRLAGMDAASKHGLWTHETLMLIERRPRTAASELAKRVGRETQSFKDDVRKLKRLGLTISHDVGYELSARGRAYVRLAASRRAPE